MLLYFLTFLRAQTLCSQYGNNTPNYTVGAGTAYLYSSNLPSTVISGATLYVVGDFIVNNGFTLANSIVKVNPNVKITVATDLVYYQSNYLSLNNTKIFACSGLWKGIELQSITSIGMSNSIIEDAEDAIKSFYTAWVSLSIDNSTFNRNKIAINLEDNGPTSWWYSPPTLSYFVNNKFTCTSPLNAIGGNTEYGLRIKNVSYPLAYNNGNWGNEFKGLKNGIYIEGQYCAFNVYKYKFDNIYLRAIDFINGNSLNIQWSIFTNIKEWGVHFSSSRELIVNNNIFSALLDPSITFRRYMVDIETPKADNYIRLNNNQWIDYAARLTCISIRPSYEPTFVNAEMASNSFYLFNPSNTTGSGIYLGGNYTSSSNVRVVNNSFNFDGNNVPASNFGIEVINGNKNNVKIMSNTFESGHATYCSFEGSTGFNNEFSDNKFISGGYGHYGLGLAIDNFQNLKVCSNIDNFATVKTYAFVNQNMNTDFTNNITYGRISGNNANLTIGGVLNNPLSYIGTQIQKGNQWLSYLGTNPLIQNFATSPTNVLLSRFVVHTNQPSIYFPTDIQTPNAPFSPFFQTLSGTPTGSCINQLVEDPVIDLTIAQAKMVDYTINPAQLLDADLHLMRKMNKNQSAYKNNQSAYKNNQSYQNFIQKNSTNNKNKFRNIEDIVDESYNINDVVKSKILDLKNQIKLLEEGNKKYNATNRPSNDEMRTYYVKRLELDNKINAYYNDNKAERKIKSKELKSIIENTTSASVPEKLYKEVYQIYLDAQINNGGIFTTEHNARMKAIASTCVTEGGMIVYVARGFLNAKDLEEIKKIVEICEPKITVEPQATIRSNTQTQKNQNSLLKATVFPNPATENFTINVNKDLSGTVQIIDLTGKLLKTVNLISGDNVIKHDLIQGVYILNIKLSDGNSVNQKLYINY